MDIFIYGTKGGARPFYQTAQGAASVFDDCRGFGNDKTLGSVAYSVEYTKKGVAFTKWMIIDDVKRDSIGFIAFAVEVEKDKRLKGKDTIDLLDKLSEEYQKKYLGKRYELEEPNEDWTFVDTLKSQFSNSLLPVDFIDSFNQGNKDAAYIYFSSKEELKKYFDAPYQPDYAEYKQVFFVDKKFKGQPANPLNALRHSEDADLTERNILENLSYRVFIPGIKEGISIRVSVNNQNINNHDKIHPRSSIRISFSKRNYHDETIQGTLNDFKTKYPNRVTVDDSNRALTIKPPHNLDPKTKNITFNIVNWKGQEINDAHISIKSSGYSGAEKDVNNNNQTTFEADELTTNWEVWVNNKQEKTFVPENTGSFLKIQIQEEKIVEFKVNAHNFAVSVHRPSSNATVIAGGKKIRFINQAVEQSCTVIVKASGYKDKELQNIYPKSQSEPIQVNLEKKKKLKYNIDRNGGINNYGSDYIEILEGDLPDYKKIKKQIKPPKGQRFKNNPFKEEKGNGNYDYVLKAQYEKKPAFYKNKRFLGIAAAVVVMVVIGYFFKDAIFGSSTDNKPVQQAQYTQITGFANSDTITSTSVNAKIAIVNGKLSSDSSIKSQQEKEDEGWFPSVLNWFSSSSDDESKSEEKDKGWQGLLARLQKEKKILAFTMNGEIDSLQSFNFNYSTNQKKFDQAIQGVDSLYQGKLVEVIKKDQISKMDLGQIATFITNFQHILKIKGEVEGSEDTEFLKKKQKEIMELKLEPNQFLSNANRIKQDILTSIEKKLPREKTHPEKQNDSKFSKPIKNKSKTQNKKKKNVSNSTRKNTTIKKESVSTEKAKEAQFEKAFWKLVHSGSQHKVDYDNLIKKYSDISYNNKVKKFYSEHLSRSDKFENFSKIPIIKLKKAKTISQLKKLISQQ